MELRLRNRMVAAAVAAGFGIFGVAQQADATVLGGWTFETSVPTTAGPHAAEEGTGSALASHASTATVYSNPVGNGSAESFSANNWSVGDYWQFSTSTTGYQDITIQWDQVASSTGPRDFQLSYSLDGVGFTNLGAEYSVLANSAPLAWTSAEYRPEHTYGPISAPAVLDDQATIYFRLTNSSTVSAGGGTVAAAGTNRVDNVLIEGTLIPEPATFGLLAAAGLLAMRRRRA